MLKIKVLFIGTIMLSVLLSGCGSLIKNNQAMDIAQNKARGFKYTQSIEQIEKAINNHILTMNAVAEGFHSQMTATSMAVTPLEKGRNLKVYRYKGIDNKIDNTRRELRSYNLLEESPSLIRFISYKMSNPKGNAYAVFTIKNHGNYRTVDVRSLNELIVKRSSKDTVNVSINGFGLNYKDFYDLDESLKLAVIDGQESWLVLQRLNPAEAKKIFKRATEDVKNRNYETISPR